MVSFRRVSPVRRYLMENQTQKKIYFHYNHTDSCKYSRWTAKDCYQFMYDRPWQQVRDFYWNVVNGFMKVSDLFQIKTQCIDNDNEIIEASGKSELVSCTTEDRTGRWERVTFKIVLSYNGGSFDGWQKQPGLNTIQGSVERSLGKFVDERKAQQLKDKNLAIEGCVVVAGRTDKGVTAIQQVCSFYTWRKDVKAQDIEDSINSAVIGKLRVLSVVKVSRIFHPTFSAKWRRYLYIFPFKEGEDVENSDQSQQNIDRSDFFHNVPQRNEYDNLVEEDNITCHVDNDKDVVESEKPTRFTVQRVNQLICQLQGKLLSYKMFARDTKASRNIGPPTECFIFHAQAVEATLPSGSKVMCVELVANRFLRKMVRVLVATSIREAAAGANDDVLLKLTDATCRRATAPPAPPDGLCLVDVGYSDFDPRKCLIP